MFKEMTKNIGIILSSHKIQNDHSTILNYQNKNKNSVYEFTNIFSISLKKLKQSNPPIQSGYLTKTISRLTVSNTNFDGIKSPVTATY